MNFWRGNRLHHYTVNGWEANVFSDLPGCLSMCVIHNVQPCAPELNRSPWIYSGCHSELLSSLCPLRFCWIYLPMDWTALPGRPPPRWTNVPEISSNVCSLHYSWPQFGHQSLSKTSPELVLTVLLQLSVWCVSHPIICPMSMTDTWREKLRVSVSPVHRVSSSVSFSFVPSCGTKSLFWNKHRWRVVL